LNGSFEELLPVFHVPLLRVGPVVLAGFCGLFIDWGLFFTEHALDVVYLLLGLFLWEEDGDKADGVAREPDDAPEDVDDVQQELAFSDQIDTLPVSLVFILLRGKVVARAYFTRVIETPQVHKDEQDHN